MYIIPNIEEVVKDLRFFGLDDIDAKVYVGIVHFGPIEIGNLA